MGLCTNQACSLYILGLSGPSFSPPTFGDESKSTAGPLFESGSQRVIIVGIIAVDFLLLFQARSLPS